MEMTQLKCFLAVARELNFTRAAKVCNMAQPSLSYQISRLEEELGEALFLRKPKAVELSESGRLLLESALRIVEEQERVVARFKGRERLMTGEVRFGIIPTMAPYLLPPLLASFRKDFPQISLVARESRTSQLVKEVVAGELEFAIVSDVASPLLRKYSLYLTRLFEEELLVAVPNAHALCRLSAMKTSALNEEELILLSEGNCLRDQTVQLCDQAGRASALVCEQLPTQLSMVGAGLGIAVVPEMAIRTNSTPNLSFLRFEAPAPKRVIGLLKKRSRRFSPAAEEFVKRLKLSFDLA